MSRHERRRALRNIVDSPPEWVRKCSNELDKIILNAYGQAATDKQTLTTAGYRSNAENNDKLTYTKLKKAMEHLGGYMQTALDKAVENRLNKAWSNHGLVFRVELGDIRDPYGFNGGIFDPNDRMPQVRVAGPLLIFAGAERQELCLVLNPRMLAEHGFDTPGPGSEFRSGLMEDKVYEIISTELCKKLVNSFPVPTAVSDQLNDACIEQRQQHECIVALEKEVERLAEAICG